MLDLDTRTAILRLRQQGHGTRTIASAVGVSRNAVRAVLRDGVAEVPKLERSGKADEHIDQVRELWASCKGNLARVHEELAAKGVDIAYSTLTAFCRRHGIGQPASPRPAGRYTFKPGEEMQHDTSPHRVKIAGAWWTVQCASLVMAYSRMMFAQVYPRWTRFECKVFLTEALRTFGGSAARCMLDNSTVIIAHGTGKDAVPAPEMATFSDRFGFEFVAHAVGDADRSARVERRFHYIENNFYPGRDFDSFADLNTQLRQWCVKVNDTFRRRLGARPTELLVVERPVMRPLPLFIPEVYAVHSRRVDVEGFVTLHTNRYSAPAKLIGRQVEVRETIDRVRIFDGHRLVAEHDKWFHGQHRRFSLPEHTGGRWRRQARRAPIPEENTLRAASPALSKLVDALREHHGGRAVRALRRLHRIYVDYPTEAVASAVEHALRFDLMDLGRIEKMVLRRIAGDFFRLPRVRTNDPDDSEDGDDER